MPTLKKLLAKFDPKEKQTLEFLIEKVVSLDWYGLDIKKLQGHQDFFRLRKGKLRIVFIKNKGSILIVAIERRNEKTYKI